MVWHEDFGIIEDSLRADFADPNKSMPGHIYQGNVKNSVQDGSYAISNSTAWCLKKGDSFFTFGRDHTNNDNGGMLVVNTDGKLEGGIIYEQKIDFPLCSNNNYYFSLFAASVTSFSCIQANLILRIVGDDGLTIDEVETGDIPLWNNYTKDPKNAQEWNEYGITFNSKGYKKISLQVINNAVCKAKKKASDLDPLESCDSGNDFVIDDICLFRIDSEEVPETNLVNPTFSSSLLNNEFKQSANFIISEEVLTKWKELYDVIYFQWQKSNDGFVWVDVPEPVSGVDCSNAEIELEEKKQQYRVIITGAETKEKAKEIIEQIIKNGGPDDGCYKYSISNALLVARPIEKPIISKITNDTSLCVDSNAEISFPFSVNVENNVPIDSFVWKMKKMDDIDWSEDKIVTKIPTCTYLSTHSEQIQIMVYAMNDTCVSDTVIFELIRNEGIKNYGFTNDSVCHGSEYEFVPKYSGNPISFYFGEDVYNENSCKFIAEKDTSFLFWATDGKCFSDTLEFSLYVEDTIRFTFKGGTDICRGEEIELRSKLFSGNVVNKVFERLFDDGTIDTLEIVENSFLQTPLQNTTYRATFYGEFCPAKTLTTRVEVEQPAILQLRSETEKVCVNNEITINAKIENTQKVRWEMKPISIGSFQLIAENLDTSLTMAIGESTIFRIVSEAGEHCLSVASNELEINIDDTISLRINKIPEVICNGETVDLNAELLSGSFRSYQWIKNSATDNKVLSNSLSASDVPYEESEYTVFVEGIGCPNYSKTFKVGVEKIPNPVLKSDVQTVCKNGDVNLTASLSSEATKVSWQKQEKEDSDFIEFSDSLFNSVIHNPASNVAYRLVVSGYKACPENFSNIINVAVEDSVSVKIKGDTVACPNSEVSFEVEYEGNPISIVWNNGSVNGEKFSTKINTEKTIRVTAKSKFCPSATDSVKIKTDSIPTFKFDASNEYVCEGNKVTFKTDFPYLDNIIWEKLNENGDFVQMRTNVDSFTFIPTSTATYRVSASTKLGCNAGYKTKTIYVDKTISSIVKDGEICFGDSLALYPQPIVDVYDYLWSSSFDFSDTLSTESKIIVSPSEQTTYYLKIRNGECVAERNLTVDVNSLPHIVDFDYDGIHQISFSAEGGSGIYEYDFGLGFSTSNSFGNIHYGNQYKVKVKDEYGCQSDTIFVSPVFDLIFPRFFTPDGDGINDVWAVENLDKYEGVKIKIYDRTGKLIDESTDAKSGWNGTYLGEQSPSTDYWYEINIEEIDKQYVGHFTLLRADK